MQPSHNLSCSLIPSFHSQGRKKRKKMAGVVPSDGGSLVRLRTKTSVESLDDSSKKFVTPPRVPPMSSPPSGAASTGNPSSSKGSALLGLVAFAHSMMLYSIECLTIMLFQNLNQFVIPSQAFQELLQCERDSSNHYGLLLLFERLIQTSPSFIDEVKDGSGSPIEASVNLLRNLFHTQLANVPHYLFLIALNAGRSSDPNR